MANNQNTGADAALAALNAGKPEAKPAANGKKLTPVKLERDYWAGREVIDQWPADADKSADQCRIKAGTVINLPKAEAQRLMEAGGVIRADPLPGDD